MVYTDYILQTHSHGRSHCHYLDAVQVNARIYKRFLRGFRVCVGKDGKLMFSDDANSYKKLGGCNFLRSGNGVILCIIPCLFAASLSLRSEFAAVLCFLLT